MGEAKRRKLLDPTWGKSDRDSDQEAKQAREFAQLIARAKRDVPDLDEKLSAACLEEWKQLTDSQQDELLKLYKDLVASDQSLEDFLKAAKPTVDPVVLELFLGQLHLWSLFSD